MGSLVPTMTALTTSATDLATPFVGLVLLVGTFAVGKWAVGFVISKLRRAV